jgi:long-chain acyl-CoA synthetase
LVPVFYAPLVLDLIERFQCTCTFGSPSMVQLLIDEQQRKPRKVRSSHLFSRRRQCPGKHAGTFSNPVRNPIKGFGMTETGSALANLADAIRAGSLGKPLDGVEVRVIDSDGADVPEGKVGEIAVRSPANFAGYWDDPAATREALRDGWLPTGDLARWDADGYLWFEGRKKEIIIRDGLNISPQEVEEAIYHHPAVLEVAAIGMPDPLPAHGERVIAFVSLRDGMVANGDELRQHALRHLADFKVPEKIAFLKALPKGITGKVQRRALKEQLTAVVRWSAFPPPWYH